MTVVQASVHQRKTRSLPIRAAPAAATASASADVGSLSKKGEANEQEQRAADVEELDAQLLADDLPIDAYLDRGFETWLKKVSAN